MKQKKKQRKNHINIFITPNGDIHSLKDKLLVENTCCKVHLPVTHYPPVVDQIKRALSLTHHFAKVGGKLYAIGGTEFRHLNRLKITSLTTSVYQCNLLKDIYRAAHDLKIPCDIGVFLRGFDTLTALYDHLYNIPKNTNYEDSVQIRRGATYKDLRKVENSLEVTFLGDILSTALYNPLDIFIANAQRYLLTSSLDNPFADPYVSTIEATRTAMFYNVL